MAVIHNFTVETHASLYHLPDNILPPRLTNREVVFHAIRTCEPSDPEEEVRQVGVWKYRSILGFRIPFTYRYIGHFALNSYGGGMYELHSDGNDRMGITSCECDRCLDGCL